MSEPYEQLLYNLDALWRRRWLALSIAGVTALVGWAIVANLPSRYESSARIYVDTANVLGPLLKGVAVDDDLEHQVDVMRRTLLSRPNLAQVARETDMDLGVSSRIEFEDLIDHLRESVQISADQENLFAVSYANEDPERARDVVQTLTAIFVENNLGEKRSEMSNAQEFIDRQIADYETKLDDAERRLAAFKQRNMQYLPGQRGLQDRLEEARAEASQLQAKLEDATTRREVIRDELATTPEMLTQQAVTGSGPPSNLEARVMETRAELENLRARYTDKHPDVVTARRRLDALIAEMQAMHDSFAAGPAAQGDTAGQDGPSDPTSAGYNPGAIRVPNPMYASLRMELVRENSNIQTLREQVARARATVARIEAQTRRVPEVEAELKKLDRDYAVIKEKYETLLSRRESARISADREQQGDKVTFRIVEPPQVPVRPSGPNRALFLTAVLMVGLGMGAGSSWLLAVTKTTYGSVNHLRRDFGIPVLGSISVLPSRRRAKRRLLDRLAFGGGLCALVTIYGVLMFLEMRVGLGVVAGQGFESIIFDRALESVG